MDYILRKLIFYLQLLLFYHFYKFIYLFIIPPSKKRGYNVLLMSVVGRPFGFR